MRTKGLTIHQPRTSQIVADVKADDNRSCTTPGAVDCLALDGVSKISYLARWCCPPLIALCSDRCVGLCSARRISHLVKAAIDDHRTVAYRIRTRFDSSTRGT